MLGRLVLAKDVDVNSISYDSSATGFSRMVPVSYMGGPLVLQTPEMLGAVSMEDDTLQVQLSFKNMAVRPGLAAFHSVLSNMDNRTEQHFEGLAFTILPQVYKERRDGTDEFFNITIPVLGGEEASCPITDSAGKKVTLQDLTAHDLMGWRVTAIIKCLGVWVAIGRYGVSWQVTALRCDPHRRVTMLPDDDHIPLDPAAESTATAT